MRRTPLLLLLPCLLLLPLAAAHAGDDEPQAANPALQKEIATLVRQLGDADYATREHASRRLLEIGEPARAALERTADETKDVEARWRAKQILLRLNGAAERPMGDDAPTPASPDEGTTEAPPATTPVVPGGPAAGSTMEELLRRFRERWRDMDKGMRFGSPLEENQVIEAPGLRLQIELWGLIARVRLDVNDENAPPGVARAYGGRSLDEILQRNPALEKLAGMPAMKTQWVAFKKAHPDVFRLEGLFDSQGRGFPGFGGQIHLKVDGVGQGTEVQKVGDRVVVKLHDTDQNGKKTTRTFEGASLEEIRKAHPEIADRIPKSMDDFSLGGTQFFRFRRGPSSAAPGPRTPGATAPAARFGVELRPVDPVLSSQLRIEEGQGLIVTEVQPGSQADQIGLERYDIILTVDGATLTSPASGTEVLRRVAAGNTPVRLGIIRHGASRVLQR
jgi:hypothetical protein